VITFGERFEAACGRARFPLSLGLDPRLDEIPGVIRERALEQSSNREDAIRRSIARFHKVAISAVADFVPAVKLQLGFYEQYGIAGMLALRDTIAAARRADLLVIADGKRNDIPVTAAAYARAYLGQTEAFGERLPAFEADALTVNPYLGRDSLVPFAETAREHGRGLFVLAHTSNPSAPELQDAVMGDVPIYTRVARLTAAIGDEYFPGGGFSSVGAIVGCTFPEAATAVRAALPRAPIVVVGYGAQAGTLAGCIACFTDRGEGALVNSSRTLTYGWTEEPVSEEAVAATIRARTKLVGNEVIGALGDPARAR